MPTLLALGPHCTVSTDLLAGLAFCLSFLNAAASSLLYASLLYAAQVSAQEFVNIQKIYLALKMMITMIAFALKIIIILLCSEVFHPECENNIILNALSFASVALEKKFWAKRGSLTTEKNLQTHH